MPTLWPTLAQGVASAEVGNWQRFLNDQRMTDQDGHALIVDESFSSRTAFATRSWQTRQKLIPTGTVTSVERAAAHALAASQNVTGFIPFVQARHCRILHPNVRSIDVITMHTMESSEKPGTAEAVARWFAGPTSPVASAHFCIDPKDVIQCVREGDVAYHAPGVNNNGIGIELAGRARQTNIDWADEASLSILSKAAKLCQKLAKRYSIPVTKLSPDELKAGGRGFCGHVDATLAFPGPGRTHWDPGPAFPYDYFFALISGNGNTP